MLIWMQTSSCFVFFITVILLLEQVDYDRRKLVAPNHTCTHMLNFALRVTSNVLLIRASVAELS